MVRNNGTGPPGQQGRPFYGSHHRQLLLDTGFARAEASVSAASWTAGTPKATKRCTSFLNAQLQGFAETALAEGWMDQITVEAVSEEIDAWAERPDALYDNVRSAWLGE